MDEQEAARGDCLEVKDSDVNKVLFYGVKRGTRSPPNE